MEHARETEDATELYIDGKTYTCPELVGFCGRPEDESPAWHELHASCPWTCRLCQRPDKSVWQHAVYSAEEAADAQIVKSWYEAK